MDGCMAPSSLLPPLVPFASVLATGPSSTSRTMASTAGPSRSGTGAGAASLANPPDDLKAIAPFLQRANETRKADPALSYWCTYHAAQMGIARAGSIQPASKAFLMSLMDSLESQKATLEGNDIVHGGDIVAKAHVENTVLKVFAGADNEDRTGNASRATARRFLAAGNFIEVLTNFGPLDVDVSCGQARARLA